MKEQWRQCVIQVPVIGFNSGKYDIDMVKEYFLKELSYNKEDECNEDVLVAKKENDYMFLTTPKFKFLDLMPYGKDTLVVNKKPFDQKRIATFSKDVLKGKVFGFAQVDIEIHNKLYAKFSEIASLFAVQERTDFDIPEGMKTYKAKTSRNIVKGTKKLLVVMKTKKKFCTLI